MQDSSTILIFTSNQPNLETDIDPDRRMRGPVDVVRKVADNAVAVSTQTLKNSVLQAYRNCLEVIESLPEHSGDAVLESVTFSLAIDGEGQVGLLSTSAKVGAQVGLSFQVRIAPRPGYR